MKKLAVCVVLLGLAGCQTTMTEVPDGRCEVEPIFLSDTVHETRQWVDSGTMITIPVNMLPEYLASRRCEND